MYQDLMEILLANHSSYPRVGAQPHEQRLRRAHAARERGEIDDAALLVVEHSVIDEILAEQVTAGLDLVTDGQIRWSDPVSFLMAPLASIRIDGLLRWFDTNFYFHQPLVTGRVARGASPLLADFSHARSASRVPVKVVLTGPYTLARLSLIEPGAYSHYGDLAYDLSVILAHHISELAAAGALVIQIDEPAIGAHPDDIRLLRRLFEPLYDARGSAQIAIATYFCDADLLYPQLNSIPADIVAVDLTRSITLGDTIATTGASKTLALGVVDGREARLEDPDAVARQLDHLLHRYALDTVYLQPSCGLEFLPRERARNKLALLAEVREALLTAGRS